MDKEKTSKARRYSHDLSYDKILKNTLAQSDELTVRFINGLFGDKIPLDAPVVWLDKESFNNKHAGFLADFYPQIAGRLYHIEVEQDDNGNMALRVFKYAVGGATLHGTRATNTEINVEFPKPCVIFLKSDENTPTTLTWNIDFFDGQKVTLKIPAIRLAELSIREIAERDLFPMGQFYLRTFESPSKRKSGEDFFETAETLLSALKEAVNKKAVPYHIGVQMQETIKKTAENTLDKLKKEVGDMPVLYRETDTTELLETLPWTDYSEVFAQIRDETNAEREMKFALTAFRKAEPGSNHVNETLKDFDIPDNIIEAAQKQVSDERAKENKAKHRSEWVR
jgi:hypothetical protein